MNRQANPSFDRSLFLISELCEAAISNKGDKEVRAESAGKNRKGYLVVAAWKGYDRHPHTYKKLTSLFGLVHPSEWHPIMPRISYQPPPSRTKRQVREARSVGRSREDYLVAETGGRRSLHTYKNLT